MRDDLYQALEASRDDPDVRSILLSAEGKNFCAGADLTEFGSAPSITAARDARWSRDLWGLFLSLDKPLVAAIHGHCIGSGLEMALLCDLRIAATNASFSMPEAHLGLIPAAGGAQTLPRILGPSKALHLLLTGQRLAAKQALNHGLISRLTSPDLLEKEAQTLALRLASLNTHAVKALKQSLNHGCDLPLPQALQLETRLALKLAHNRNSPTTHLVGATLAFACLPSPSPLTAHPEPVEGSSGRGGVLGLVTTSPFPTPAKAGAYSLSISNSAHHHDYRNCGRSSPFPPSQTNIIESPQCPL